MRKVAMVLAVLALSACVPEEENEAEAEAPVRGLKTVTVEAREDSVLRRFPSVLQPSELSAIAFESPGKIGAMSLTVGQTVAKGEELAQLDDTDLRLQIAAAEAATEQARVAATNASEALERAEQLLERGTVTRVSVDNTRTEAVSRAQALVQSEQSLAQLRKRLNDAGLSAPFDGTIASVEVQSFATVAAGIPIATIYREGQFEASFTVNYDTVSRLVVGTPAKLVLADDPDQVLAGVVSELGARAETVSSFPVVVAVQKAPDLVKAGMAVEVQLEFSLPASHGYSIPISAAVVEGQPPQDTAPHEPAELSVFVFNPETGRVEKRQVIVAGVRDNALLVTEGLEPGDRVASAGVSFLSDGMKAKLID